MKKWLQKLAENKCKYYLDEKRKLIEKQTYMYGLYGRGYEKSLDYIGYEISISIYELKYQITKKIFKVNV